MGEEIGDDQMEVSEEFDYDQMEGEVETQQATSGSKFHQVSVTVKQHTLSKDEIIFKDRKGKPRRTYRSDWLKVEYNGGLAWTHGRYICFDDILD